MNRSSHKDQLTRACRHMLDHDLYGRGIRNKAVLEAMAEIPREAYVPPDRRTQAYDDHPLPIGQGQTISQPYIVALMTEVLYVTSECEVLEIGTGSGYQTAVLAGLGQHIFTMERWAELSHQAQQVLQTQGFSNITYEVGDGSQGWPEQRFFDRVMITAAVPQVPKPLWDQLKIGGRLIAPVGSESVQSLVLQKKTKNGMIETDICQVRFVRLFGAHGFSE